MGIVIQGVNIKPTVAVGGLHIPKSLLYKALGIGGTPLIISGLLSLSTFPILSGGISLIYMVLCFYLHPHSMRILTIIVSLTTLMFFVIGLTQFASIPLALYLSLGVLFYIRDMAKTEVNHGIRFDFEENFVPDSFEPYGVIKDENDPLYGLLHELDFSLTNFRDYLSEDKRATEETRDNESL